MEITAQQIVDIVVAVGILASAIAAVTPTEKDDKVVGRIRNLIRKIVSISAKEATEKKDSKK